MKTNGFMHTINASETPKLLSVPVVVGICIFAVVLGSVGGFLMVKKPTPATVSSPKGTAVQTDKAAGVIDKKTFKDSIIGMLKEGGMEGEGNFHLERPGGVSQNVYLTSTTVDLSKYIGKKLRYGVKHFKDKKQDG